MPDVFGVEGPVPGPGKRPAKPVEQDPSMLYGSLKPDAGVTKPGKWAQFDNESGAIHVDLPPHLAAHKRELEEDLMDAFYGEPAGGAEASRSLDAWVSEWIARKEQETGSRPPVEE